MPALAEIEATVLGKVQMVFFRVYTKKHADTLSLTGFVENALDGSVHVVAQGKRENLEVFLRALREGPPASSVEDIAVAWREPKAVFECFEIR